MRAIVLDDAELNNLLMLEALRPIPDCRPQSFTRPADALAFAEAHAEEIGIVLTDYEMPGMDGLAVIRALRELSGFVHVPIVMVTSFDQRALRRSALEAGATDFVNKPCDPVEIRARVTNWRSAAPIAASAPTPPASPRRSPPPWPRSRRASARSSTC
jgi:putative two-component system response regulator